jgi:hypothetical protein
MPIDHPEPPGVKAAGRVLDYDTPAPVSGTLTLEESDGCVRVIFPAPSMWTYVVTIGSQFLAGAGKFAMGVYAVVIVLDLGHTFPRTAPAIAMERHFVLQIIIGVGISAAFWWGLAGFGLWKYRRWGRVPRILTLNKDELILTRLGLWKMRERKWAAGEITSVEFKPIKGNLNRKQTLASLRFNRRKGRRLNFRLSSRDPQLPMKITEKMALTLGCPLAASTG